MEDVGMWVFGYGSLMWRPDLPAVREERGSIRGWQRRFWQASTDHRGTEEYPGRVVTLVPRTDYGSPQDSDDGWCVTGIAYGIPHHEVEATRQRLDHREKQGYDLFTVDVQTAKGNIPNCMLYVATAGNPMWVGPQPGETGGESMDDLATRIACSVGPSGPNVEYLHRLVEAVRLHGSKDPYLEELDALVRVKEAKVPVVPDMEQP